MLDSVSTVRLCIAGVAIFVAAQLVLFLGQGLSGIALAALSATISIVLSHRQRKQSPASADTLPDDEQRHRFWSLVDDALPSVLALAGSAVLMLTGNNNLLSVALVAILISTLHKGWLLTSRSRSGTAQERQNQRR
ncbi:MAG: hypothetical protein ACTJHU_07490 [Mycetocola sp.]